MYEYETLAAMIEEAERVALEECAVMGSYEPVPKAFDLYGAKYLRESFAGVFGMRDDALMGA